MCDDSTVVRHNCKDSTFGTKLIHAGHDTNEWTYKDVVPPISMSTIFNSPSPGVFSVNVFFFFISITSIINCGQ